MKGTLFIDDEEIRERFGDDAELIIDGIDRLPATQKGLATVPEGKRVRASVDKWLAANGHG